MTVTTRILTTSAPIFAAVVLYFVFSKLGILPWQNAAMAGSMALAAASFAQAATIASLAGTVWYRSPAMRKFGFDSVLSLALSIPVSMIIHARFLYLQYGLAAVFDERGWNTWQSTGGAAQTLYFVFILAFGVISFIRLIINRHTQRQAVGNR